MMSNRGRHPSDVDSLSSGTSDITSRATTQVDTWSDIRSEATIDYQQGINGVDPSDLPTIPDGRSSVVSSEVGSVDTVVSQKQDQDQTHKKQYNDINANNQQQQQQQPWINPYSGSHLTPNKTENQSTPNKSTNIMNSEQSISSLGDIQQLIPGSILINDEGEIDDASKKHNGNLKSTMSENSFNPGGQYIADDNGGPGGYLAPTHIQRRIVTSSPGLSTHPETQFGYKRSSSSSDASIQNRPTLNRQQTFPESTDNNIHPWINPYWSKSNLTNTPSLQNGDSSRKENSLLLNDSIPKSSINPNSAINTIENSTPLTDINKSQISGIPIQSNQPWINPYWKDKSPLGPDTNVHAINTTLLSGSKAPLIPTFYERIYPSNTLSPVSVLEFNDNTQNKVSDKQPNKNTDDSEDASYSMDNNGIVHYRGESLSSTAAYNNVNAVINSNSMPSPIQHSSGYSEVQHNLPSSIKVNTALPPPANNFLSSPYPSKSKPHKFNNLSMEHFSLLSLSAPSTSRTITVLSEADLNSIRDALCSLETNPNAISIIGSSEQAPISNINNSSISSLSLNSLYPSSNQHQSQTSQTPGSITRALPDNTLSFPYHPASLPAQAPPSTIAGPATGNTPAFPFNTGSQQGQPPPATQTGPPPGIAPGYPFNPTSQQAQPPPPAQAGQTTGITPGYPFNPTSQQAQPAQIGPTPGNAPAYPFNPVSQQGQPPPATQAGSTPGNTPGYPFNPTSQQAQPAQPGPTPGNAPAYPFNMGSQLGQPPPATQAVPAPGNAPAYPFNPVSQQGQPPPATQAGSTPGNAPGYPFNPTSQQAQPAQQAQPGPTPGNAPAYPFNMGSQLGQPPPATQAGPTTGIAPAYPYNAASQETQPPSATSAGPTSTAVPSHLFNPTSQQTQADPTSGIAPGYPFNTTSQQGQPPPATKAGPTSVTTTGYPLNTGFQQGQPPLAASGPISGNILYSTPSYPDNLKFQQSQVSQAASLPTSSLSGNIQYGTPSYPYNPNSNSQESPPFSKHRYPLNSKELLKDLQEKGSIVLI